MRREDRFFVGLGVVGGLLILGGWILGQYDWYPATLKQVKAIPRGIILGLVFCIAAYLGHTFTAEMRSKSPVAIAENRRWSWNPVHDQPRPAGAFYVVPVGGIEAMGFSTKGRDALVVVHRDGFQQIDVNARFHTPVRKAKLRELPDEARDLIRRERAWKGMPTYFGFAPSFVEARVRDYSRDARQAALANVNKDLSEQASMRALVAMDRRVRVLQTVITDQGSEKVDGMFKRAKRKLFGSQSEDEKDDAEGGS